MMTARLRPLALCLVVCSGAVACSSSDPAPSSGAADSGGETTEEPTFGGDRPVTVRVPAGYDGATPLPFVVLLHGYGASGFVQDVIFRISSVADEKGYFFAAPDGTFDEGGSRFWNATDACCDFGGTGVDDVAYLTKLVSDVKAAYAIDPKRVYFIGHSNGGFMSHRLACDAAGEVAAIVSVAGAVFADPSRCNPSEPVAVLQIHGTNDGSVTYEGQTESGFTQPGAPQTVATWAQKNGCDPTPTEEANALDLEGTMPGDETTVTRYGGCTPNGAAELWTIPGGSHVPNFVEGFPTLVWDFFASHAKP